MIQTLLAWAWRLITSVLVLGMALGVMVLGITLFMPGPTQPRWGMAVTGTIIELAAFWLVTLALRNLWPHRARPLMGPRVAWVLWNLYGLMAFTALVLACVNPRWPRPSLVLAATVALLYLHSLWKKWNARHPFAASRRYREVNVSSDGPPRHTAEADPAQRHSAGGVSRQRKAGRCNQR